MNMMLFKTLILCLTVYVEIGAAPMDYTPLQFIPLGALPPAPPGNNPKLFWNFVGDLINNSGFLPIEVNIPDTVQNLATGAQNVVQSIGMVAGNLLQRIPIVTRLTSPERPRPFKVLVVNQNGEVMGMINNY